LAAICLTYLLRWIHALPRGWILTGVEAPNLCWILGPGKKLVQPSASVYNSDIFDLTFILLNYAIRTPSYICFISYSERTAINFISFIFEICVSHVVDIYMYTSYFNKSIRSIYYLICVHIQTLFHNCFNSFIITVQKVSVIARRIRMKLGNECCSNR
jgi:hypothetical protein